MSCSLSLRRSEKTGSHSRFAAIVVVTIAAGLPVYGLDAQSELIDRIWAVVSGEVITQSDVEGALALGLVSLAGLAPEEADGQARRTIETGQRTDDARRAALDLLIERALMLVEVRRYLPPEPDSATVAQRLEAIRQRFPSPSAFSQALATHGVDEIRLREFVRDDLRIEAYLSDRFSSPEPGRRRTMMADWLTGLRRRAAVTVMYQGGP